MKNAKFSYRIINLFMKNRMQNKSYIILDIINMFTRCFIVFLLYAYIFKINGGSINGTDYESTLWSMFIYSCILTLSLRKIYILIMKDVKSGNVEMFLNKPIDYLVFTFCKSIGEGLYSFLVITFFGTILMLLFVGSPDVDLVIFIPTLIIVFLLGQILSLFMYSIIGLLSFFMQDVRSVYWVTDKFIMLLGGSYLPVSLFPKFMKTFAYVSPFGAINFATSSVFNTWNSIYIKMILMQVIWILVFGILLKFVYKKAREKSMINGG